MKKRPICIINGCNNLAMPTGKKKDGSVTYKNLCATHHTRKYNMPHGVAGKKRKVVRQLREEKCTICGWGNAECDVHRIKYGCNGGKYVTGNVMTVCPNCHRLIHRGLLNIN